MSNVCCVKSGTGSVVFLKPKGNITILQLMLNPTALTQIFDENFPGWGVKQMKVRVPEASFTTNSQHHDMLVKVQSQLYLKSNS